MFFCDKAWERAIALPAEEEKPMSSCSSCSSTANAAAYMQQAIQAKTDPREILRAQQEAARTGNTGTSEETRATVNTQGQTIGTLLNATA